MEDTDAPEDPVKGLFRVRIETSWVQTYVQDQIAMGQLMEHAHLANHQSELLFAKDDDHSGAYAFTAVNKQLWPQSQLGEVEFVKSAIDFGGPPAVHALLNQ